MRARGAMALGQQQQQVVAVGGLRWFQGGSRMRSGVEGTGEEKKETKQKVTMTFDEFGKLRKTLKWSKRVMGLPGSFMGVFSLVAASETKPDLVVNIAQQVGWEAEPTFMAGAVLCAFSGYMLTGGVVEGTFRLFGGQRARNMDIIAEDFALRVKKYRFEGQGKFQDDFHGENVSTTQQYRTWLRKQYQRKKAARLLDNAAAQAEEREKEKEEK
eukprot:Nk52_evm6s375 gene=Nk52_evmTU6s375